MKTPEEIAKKIMCDFHAQNTDWHIRNKDKEFIDQDERPFIKELIAQAITLERSRAKILVAALIDVRTELLLIEKDPEYDDMEIHSALETIGQALAEYEGEKK